MFHEQYFSFQGGAIQHKHTRQLDRVDTILSGIQLDEQGGQYPLHPPTGERTRKTYDFTSTDKCEVTGRHKIYLLYIMQYSNCATAVLLHFSFSNVKIANLFS